MLNDTFLANYVDAYKILPTSLAYIESRSLIPKGAELPDDSKYHFRGDTLMLSRPVADSPNPKVLITTTRGSNPGLRGWLSIFPLDELGRFTDLPSDATTLTSSPRSVSSATTMSRTT